MDKTEDNEPKLIFTLPGWVAGTDLSLNLVWVTGAALAGNQKVPWNIWWSTGDVPKKLVAEYSDINLRSQKEPIKVGVLQKTRLGVIPGNGLASGDKIHLRIERHGDPDAQIFRSEVEYIANPDSDNYIVVVSVGYSLFGDSANIKKEKRIMEKTLRSLRQ